MGLTVAKKDEQWLITEASLDNMLEAYTKRQGAGDDIFIPIVKNPQGGDSLALFFGFNEDSLSKRSERQLQIVAEAIKTQKQIDIDKKKIQMTAVKALGTFEAEIRLMENISAKIKVNVVAL